MAIPRPPGLDRWHARFIVRWMSWLNAWIYKKTAGRLGGRFLRGAPVLLLTTTGRKSGLPRTKPLLYLRDRERLVVVASVGGMKDHPLWYKNLLKTPAVQVQIGGTQEAYIARVANDLEREALWPGLVAMYKDYNTYQSWTSRIIPVVILEPASPNDS